jgi:hypothetical protein
MENDVQPTLETYYERHVSAITEQVERSEPTKEFLLEHSTGPYWEGKADQLKIPYNLMDLTAPLPPCVSLIIARQIDGMLEDFNDLEEWFFGFKKAPPHEKQTILDGYEDGSYITTLHRRRDERSVFIPLNDSGAAVVDPALPIFGPSSKKLKQTTLTQDYNEYPGLKSILANQTNLPVIDLTPQPTSSYRGAKRKSIIDLTRKPVKLSSVQTPPVNKSSSVQTPPSSGSQLKSGKKKKFVVDSPLRTPP